MVHPEEVLEITVGGGGAGGTHGERVQIYRPNIVEPKQETRPGIASGGMPGGGLGHGGNESWAAGGGGGYTMLTALRSGIQQTLLVAGAGGGGGSRDGIPGGHEAGEPVGHMIDPRNGRCGNGHTQRGGKAGDSGEGALCAFAATKGGPWQGGNGAAFGGGGGGGFYGGGGGGTSPGIVGGGGGGACYVCPDVVTEYRVIPGKWRAPGGWPDVNIPLAAGVGEWDLPGGIAGEGGPPDAEGTKEGNNGALRIYKPGFYDVDPPVPSGCDRERWAQIAAMSGDLNQPQTDRTKAEASFLVPVPPEEDIPEHLRSTFKG